MVKDPSLPYYLPLALARIVKFVAERNSSHIFTQWGWRIPFGPDDFPGQIEFGESPPNYLILKIFRTGLMSFCPRSYSSRSITSWGEPSNSWAFGSTLLDQRFLVEYELDELIPLRHSATSFLDNLLGDHYASLLQQTGPCIFSWIFHSCSKINNSIFALAVAMHISLRHLAALFFLNSITIFFSNHYDDQHKGFLSNKRFLNF